MSLPANDSLSSGTQQTIQAYSANWTAVVGTINVASTGNGAFPAASGNDAAFWNADSFPNDQYAQCTISVTGPSPNFFIGPSVRASTTGTLSEYAFRVNPHDSLWQVVKFVNNVLTNLSGNTAGTFVVNDVLKLQVIGTTLTAFQNSTQLYTTTDNSIGSGSGGLAGSGNATSSGPVVKNWQAGAAGVVSVPLYMYSVRNVLYFI